MSDLKLKIWIGSLGASADYIADRLRELAVRSQTGKYILVDKFGIANYKLYACDEGTLSIAKNIVLKNNEYVFCIAYKPESIATIAGCYTSMSSNFFSALKHVAVPYPNLKNTIKRSKDVQMDYLYSFMGSVAGIKCRQKIMELHGDSAYLRDTTDVKMFKSQENKNITDAETVLKYKHKYAEIILRSKFVLCPRGVGNSSFRLYETLSAGRVPVILSDSWVQPEGPIWSNCSVRIAEKEINNIPEILRKIEPNWPLMAENA